MATALTRLALAKHLAGWSGTMLPADVTDTETPVTEQEDNIVRFIDQSWLDIQLAHHLSWGWMLNQSTDTVALTPSTRTLAMSAFGVTANTIRPFIAHDTEPLRYIALTHPTDGSVSQCVFHNYEYFRGFRDRGTRPVQRPTRFTILRDGTLEFDATPDLAYTVNLDWVQFPKSFALDADTPDMPNHFHMLVVWWAMIHQMDFDENGGRYQTSDRQYKKMYNRLLIEQLSEDLHDEFLSTNEVYSW